ncbi:MAG: universal stress protein [Solirubrobacteraceae bacterium]
MSSSAQHGMPRPLTSDPDPDADGLDRPSISRIAAAVDGFPEGEDAVALANSIVEATGAELMLVAVHLDPLIVIPEGATLRKHQERSLRTLRDTLAPGARIAVERDFSVARALSRVVSHHHRDLLVVGSSRQGPPGHVRIGKRTRQLLCHFDCALAVAPRGIHARPPIQFRRIGVGYDGGPESTAALALAGAIAAACGADLTVRSVVDDRVPLLVRSALGGLVATEWHETIVEEEQRLHDQALAAVRNLGANASAEVLSGRPADALLALSNDVDLLVIGSRRWGPSARVLLGTTGEALLHDAACSVLTVPRPPESA